jgi:hypothetical protein
MEFELKFIVASVSKPGSAGSTIVRGLPDGNGVQAEVWIRNEQVKELGIEPGSALGFVKAAPKGKKQTSWVSEANGFKEVIDLKHPRQTYVVANGIAHQAASKESLALVDEFEMNRSSAVSVLPVIKF